MLAAGRNTYIGRKEKTDTIDSDLLPEDAICEMIRQTLRTQNQNIYPVSRVSLKYYKTYLLRGKANGKTSLQILCCFERSVDGECKKIVYLAAGFCNLTLRLNGETELKYDVYLDPMVITDIDNTLKRWEIDFDVEELYIELPEVDVCC